MISYGAERSGANRQTVATGDRGARPSCSARSCSRACWRRRTSSADPGLLAGAACAALALAAVGGLLERAGRRLDAGAAGLLTVYADLAALVLAAVAIFLEPAAYLALAAFVLLLVRGREQGERKYAGLRILR